MDFKNVRTLILRSVVTYPIMRFSKGRTDAGILRGGVSRVSEFQYFGLVPLSTLGYGEITPITPPAHQLLH